MREFAQSKIDPNVICSLKKLPGDVGIIHSFRLVQRIRNAFGVFKEPSSYAERFAHSIEDIDLPDFTL